VRRDISRAKRVTAFAATSFVAGMLALSFAAVPLYREFCQVTGFGGTTQRAAAAPGSPGNRVIIVRFNADTDPGIPWRFEPEQNEIKVRVGEPSLARYRATNLSAEPVIGAAVFNVTPLKAGLYFDKIQCFCFSEQKLAPGASAELPVTFFVNPDIAKDRNLDDVSTITLSYTFYRDKDAEAREKPRIAGASAPKTVN
jgi:cytochrome c oxidase assembly protein subunit 11